MAVTNSVTGRQGFVEVEGTFLPITKWSMKLTKQFADATDSNTFDEATGQVWTYQDPGVVGMEGTIAGNIDLDLVQDQVINRITQDGPFSVTLGLTRTRNYVTDSPFDLTDCEMNVEVTGASMLTYSFTAKSHGIPTFG